MRYSREVLEEIRQRIGIDEVVGLTVTLNKSSGLGKYKGLCPFHQEDTPSFIVDTTKNLFYCFGCQAGGDVFRFLMNTKGISFGEAVRELADQSGISLKEMDEGEKKRFKKKRDLYEICVEAAAKFTSDLLTRPEAQGARDYLEKRNLSEETMLNFQFGYAQNSFDSLLNYFHSRNVTPEQLVAAGLARYRDPQRPNKGAYSLFRDRIIIPIRDYRGRIVAFGGRKMPGTEKSVPKYINSPETEIYKKSKTLYALSMARPSIQKQNRAIIVEGYFDVVTLHQAGFKEAIATCGTALTVEHLATLRPLTTKVISVFDSDEAGLRAAEKSYPLFLDATIESFQLELQGSKDPDEFINSFGPEKFADNLKRARTLFELKLDLLIQRHGLSPGSKQKITEELAPYLRKMPSVTRDSSISQVARQLGVLEASIRSYVGRSKQKEQKSTKQNPHSQWSILVRDLIWLLIHFPSFVRPLLEALEPTSISTNNDLLFVMGLFMEGHSVTEVIENVSNENIRSMLLELSVLDELYVEEDISKAVPQIIDRIRLSNLKRSLLLQQRELSQRSPETDMMSYLVSLKELQNTRREMEVLQQSVRDLSVRS